MNDYLVRYHVDGQAACEVWVADSVEEAELLFTSLHPYYHLDSIVLIED